MVTVKAVSAKELSRAVDANLPTEFSGGGIILLPKTRVCIFHTQSKKTNIFMPIIIHTPKMYQLIKQGKTLLFNVVCVHSTPD